MDRTRELLVFLCVKAKKEGNGKSRGDLRTIDQLTAVVLVQDHEEGVCIVKSSVFADRIRKGRKAVAKRMCARVQAEKMLYDA